MLRPGALTNAAPGASAAEGQLELSNAFRKGTTVTSGNLQCVVSDNTTGDCASTTTSAYYIGVATATNGGSSYVAREGVVVVNLDASSTWNANDFVCVSATGSALGHMNGTTACSGRRIGFAQAGGSSASVVKTVLSIN